MIKKTFILVLITIIWFNRTNILKAQSPIVSQKEIVSSELNFARTAKQMGLKYAFEQNLDSTAMIASGVHLVNGLKAYAKVTAENNDLLVWHPTFARTNLTEDFGFTTGPYLYYSRRGEQAVASGNYFSIWKKDKNQRFKLLFDGGVNHTSINEDYPQAVERSNTQLLKFKKSKKMQQPAPPDLTTTHEAYNYLDKEVLILRADHPIRLGKAHYTDTSAALLYHQKQSGYDESGKFYYEVGNLYDHNPTIDLKKIKGFYAQVWRFEKKWTIIADVVQLAH
ncbi:hypothetical protein [Pedobacter sp.]|uniref:hypothetical protein n=1 Tax=Pedobacter sp. TaxID=1411316 RepID=UPI0031D96738